MDDGELTKRYNQTYLEIIMKYREYIETKESISVAELPTLVTPTDESVVATAAKIKSAFPDYSYERDFYNAAKAAFDYVHNDLLLITLPIQFWLSPQQTIKCGGGDTLDKATLLCSLLISLGDPSSKIIISTSDDSRHVMVYSEYNGILAIDMEEGIRILKDKEELLKQLGIAEGSEATAYEFNDKMYNDMV